jgi:tRNA pseudouridine13 synthase
LLNAVLDARLADGSWATVIDGEVVNLSGSGSCFTGPVDDTLRERCRQGDVHATGPLCGRGGTRPTGRAAEIESAALQPFADLVAALEQVADADRRPLRMLPGELRAELIDDDTVALSFTLPPGAYATTLLDELVEWTEEFPDAGTDRA